MMLYLGYFLHSQFNKQVFYTMAAEEEQSIPLYDICIQLDDALLEPLKEIWKASENLEDFDWVFVDDKLPFSKYKCHRVDLNCTT